VRFAAAEVHNEAMSTRHDGAAQPTLTLTLTVTGMAATGSYDTPPDRVQDGLRRTGAGELQSRLEEEVARAERHGTALSCLLVSLDAERLREQHGEELLERALGYMAAALGRQLRRFDRVGRLCDGELLVLLPGADGPRAEIVARRALARLRAVKVELDSGRRSIALAIGLGTWAPGLSAEQLLDHTRLASRRGMVKDAVTS
jgi:GGDEF domain-containing protein